MRLKWSPDMLKQLWKMYYQTSKMLMFTLMMLVLSPIIGTTTSICWLPFYINYVKWFYHQPTQMWMGLQENWLAWLLAYTTRFKALEKKIDAIFHMDCPRNATELGMLIGCMNYHCDMWLSRTHILKLLLDQSGLKKKALIKWTDEMQKVFDKMCLLMAANALAAYPDQISGLTCTLMSLTSS
jgi:hypothetical protein